MTDFPLSFAQQRIRFLDEVRARDHGLSDHRVFRVTGRLDVAALRHALAQVVARHETLRTTYPDGGLVQRVAATGELPLTVVDVPDEPTALAEAARRAQTRFSLATGPLATVTVLRVAADLCFLVLTFHLLVMDGWGLMVWSRDVSACYRSRTAELPSLPIQYADWAVWSRARLTTEYAAELAHWWRRSLAGYPRLIGLPTTDESREVPGPVGRRRYRSLPARLANDVAALARSEGATRYSILATAYAIALRAHTGQPRMLVAVPVVNRDVPEVQDLLGFFVDTVTLPVDLTGDPTGRDAWRRVAAATAAAYAHRELPFDQVVAALAEPPIDGRFPLAQAGFVYRPAGSLGELVLAGCEVTDVPVDVDRTRFEFMVRVDETPAGTVACAEFDSTLFAPAFAERFLHDYVTALTSLVADPSAGIPAVEPTPEPPGDPCPG